jgi:hypothetical protein
MVAQPTSSTVATAFSPPQRRREEATRDARAASSDSSGSNPAWRRARRAASAHVYFFTHGLLSQGYDLRVAHLQESRETRSSLA